MIAFVLLAAMTPAAAPAGPSDIVVTAAKLRKIRLSADSDDSGRITACRVTVSSGDKMLDDHACDATKACAAGGIGSPDAISDCVDGRLIAFATGRATNTPEKRN
ncbi:MAG: hypothetical protein JWL91_2033 [Sphingomonas bacterium]|nr:hypothetical protein [Sphingomonas bacterium]MDB5690157.1 hypothetical protein [Sphingomonas bacterium]